MISLTLLPLLIFKYYTFITKLIIVLAPYKLDLFMPLGLSFYAFSIIGYYVDVYKKDIKTNQKFIDIILFTSFWPHLAAGPILRTKNIF